MLTAAPLPGKPAQQGPGTALTHSAGADGIPEEKDCPKKLMFCTLKCTFGALCSCQTGFAASALYGPWTQPQGTCLMVAEPKAPKCPCLSLQWVMWMSLSTQGGAAVSVVRLHCPGCSHCLGSGILPTRNAASTTPFHRLQTHTWTLTHQHLCPEMAQDTFNLFLLVQYSFLQP